MSSLCPGLEISFIHSASQFCDCRRIDKKPLLMAALFDVWRVRGDKRGTAVRSCIVVTTDVRDDLVWHPPHRHVVLCLAVDHWSIFDNSGIQADPNFRHRCGYMTECQLFSKATLSMLGWTMQTCHSLIPGCSACYPPMMEGWNGGRCHRLSTTSATTWRSASCPWLSLRKNR